MNTIKYQDVIDLGFKRKDVGGDKVFFEENGYEWFIVTKKIAKRLHGDWDSETKTVEIYRTDGNGNIVKRKKNVSYETLKEIIEFYTD